MRWEANVFSFGWAMLVFHVKCLEESSTSSKHWTGKQHSSTETDTVLSFSHHCSSFFTVYLLFKCRFVAWQRGLPWKFDCVFVLINTVLLNLLCFWISRNIDRYIAIKKTERWSDKYDRLITGYMTHNRWIEPSQRWLFINPTLLFCRELWTEVKKFCELYVTVHRPYQ